MRRRRVGVLISGRGTNLAALIAAAAAPDYPAAITVVVSNRADAAGLARAAEARVPTAVVDHKAFADRLTFEHALDRALGDAEVEFICLAGFMRLFTPWFVERWAGRILNIHPSLLPAFRGIDTHAQALKAGVLIHGCSVHFVTDDLDAGPILAQAAVPVRPDDTAETLAARVLAQEHRIYPMALRMVCEGSARLVGDRVRHERQWGDGAALAVPPVTGI